MGVAWNGSELYADLDGLPFGYANEMLALVDPADPRDEDHVGHETLNGRATLVRFVIAPVTADSCRFEQAFSDDGGRTWELNWIAADTRIED